MIGKVLRSSYVLEVVLESNIEVKGIAPVSKADAYERAAACREKLTQ